MNIELNNSELKKIQENEELRSDVKIKYKKYREKKQDKSVDFTQIKTKLKDRIQHNVNSYIDKIENDYFNMARSLLTGKTENHNHNHKN